MAAEPDTRLDLFADGYAQPRWETLGPGAVLLGPFASSRAGALLAALEEVVQRSPFRFMTTPGGYRMSVAMTNCGAVGWVTDGSSAPRSSPYHWGCRRYSCSALTAAPTARGASLWPMETWWSGAARRGCDFTACSR